MAIHKLTASKIARLTTNGMYGDGGNLWLQVTNNGAGKSWLFRWTERGTGRERNMGLGPLHTVDLDRARDLAKGYRLMLLEGKDPKTERDNAKLDDQIAAGLAKTVSQVADEYFETKIAGSGRSWRVRATKCLNDVKAAIGHMPIQKVNRHTILEKCRLRELWNTEKTHRYGTDLRRHLDRMFRLALSLHYYHGDNPAAWKGGLENVLRPSSKVHQTKHLTGLPKEDVYRFIQAVREVRLTGVKGRSGRGKRSPASLLVEFIVLSGVRINEALVATWKEFDRTKMVWTVPWQHLKMGHFHHTDRPVPITKAMLVVLDEMERRTDQSPDALVFPSNVNSDGPMNQQSVSKFISRSAKWETRIHLHGFRSTLRDWCRANRFPAEWWDIQADHRPHNKTSQSYGHDPLIEERRGMMELWGEYCSKPAPEPKAGEVVHLSSKRRPA